MTDKKQRVRQARSLRRVVRGVDLPTSVKLVRLVQNGDWSGFVSLLSTKGFFVDSDFQMDPCDVCGFHTVGKLYVKKGGRVVGVLDYHDGVVLP
ncbi:hypothetical protein [Geobacillus subterraneus]|uniref:Uncharacterized protein n=1 Tax=Geobacillus subterraneus TaxID=129338 RepID=A0A679FVJ6_9BACL|nr:hypothetical protein [Geobacillus subterraneus]BBW98989.1 hypothetical protein GsuE55_38220 [Geobacillus subterraneus]